MSKFKVYTKCRKNLFLKKYLIIKITWIALKSKDFYNQNILVIDGMRFQEVMEVTLIIKHLLAQDFWSIIYTLKSDITFFATSYLPILSAMRWRWHKVNFL